jgi:nucleoside-diphosphate-sugar epimerase
VPRCSASCNVADLLRSLLQNQLMVPAVEGTLNVLRAAKDAGGVRRVVITSSISAIVPSPGWPAGEVRDERCWTDIDYCEKNGVSELPSELSILFFFRDRAN